MADGKREATRDENPCNIGTFNEPMEIAMAADDDIRLFPVVGWETATLPEGNVLLTVNYLPGEPSRRLTTEQMHALADVHRFGITAAQCDELAEVLQRAAASTRERQRREK